MSKAEYSLVISAEVCPLTTVNTKVFLDNTASRLAGEDCR